MDNNLNFDIPMSIIVLAFLFCWPVGIILAILRSSSKSINKKTVRDRVENRNFVEINNAGKIKKKISRKTKIASICGGAFVSLSLFIFLSYAVESFVDFGFSIGHMYVSGFGVLLMSILCAVVSFALRGIFAKKDAHLNKLRTIIGNRESINLTKLAAASGVELKKIRKDVQEMIDDGEYGDSAYIDVSTNNFMKYPYAQPDDPEAFDYRKVYGDLFKKDRNSQKNEKSQEDEKAKDVTENVGVIDDSDDFQHIIKEIRRLNDDIKDIEVSDRIYKIETHTKNIFDYVTDHPEAMPQIRTFMNYYLPTTLKLLESYKRIERVGVAGENMKKSKADIENILDLLCVGFEQQIDQLFKNEYIDISSDISVLEKMMKKDGLSSKNDFDISSYVDEVSDDISGSSSAALELPENKE
ncbi:MAG: hypothetical protein E7672_07975 [Ruminococcaceae bacterium]|nr:hypothetical protein [Oscillospiraceae bacterium]